MSEFTSGNIFIRTNYMAKTGDRIDGHKHNFDHTSCIMAGAVRVTARLPDGDVVWEANAPAHILIKAGVEHEIIALQDNSVFWCIYAHRAANGEVIQDYQGYTKAYM